MARKARGSGRDVTVGAFTALAVIVLALAVMAVGGESRLFSRKVRFLAVTNNVQYKTSDRWMHELLWPDLSKPWEQEHRLKMLAEAHSRIASPLYNLAMMALALAAVIGG